MFKSHYPTAPVAKIFRARLLFGPDKIPNDQAHNRKDQDQQRPQDFSQGRCFALNDLEDRPNIGYKDYQPD
jgi:hypothetical protein